MILLSAIQCIGASHLLQPPLTLLLARRLTLAREFANLAPLPGQIARNMAMASVALPTCAGCLLGAYAREVVDGHGIKWLAWLMAAFWCWRLLRQRAIGALMPPAWHRILMAIFTVQGPLFAVVLILTGAA